MLAQPALQIKAHEPDAPAESEFSVIATAPASRPRRALKHGDTFIVADNYGDIGATAGGTDGLYHADTRFLSHLELSLNGSQPLLLGSNVRDDNTLLAVDLTNPDYYVAAGRRSCCRRTSCTSRARCSSGAARAYQRLACATTATGRIALQIALQFDSDFADLFEVRGCTARAAARSRAASLGRTRRCCSYLGPRQRDAAHAAHLRSAPNEICREQGLLSPCARAAANRSRSSWR